MNYSKKTDFFDIYIEPARKTIVVRSKWKYIWKNEPGTSLWTYAEKKEWHRKADTIIWQQWGNQFDMIVSVKEKSHPFYSYNGTTFNLEFDIEWVTSNPHWTASIIKTKSLNRFDSYINFDKKTLNLDYHDLNYNSFETNVFQNTIKHEFGHIIFNDDEYHPKYGGREISTYVHDVHGLMNIGNELRYRYLHNLEKYIDSIIYKVKFIPIFKT
ncbi:hypothetical protein [Cochleicola gelatinilyticus]|uniref:Uncharacterized protein n=1 Tax=Cochleicola gelatinilyticus TaxID=1763537 RepID=A0A167HLK7_9FLAO|nr:hypothetical protein [Cochleicola gelatinilyticus]OAB78742.1 hypothetical protein ULVI_09170 [Cochleicola gelatinilyticus]